MVIYEAGPSAPGSLLAIDSNAAQSNGYRYGSKTTDEEKIRMTARTWLMNCHIVRLRCTAQAGMKGEDYMTLSDCRGDLEKMVKLTKANLNALICGMILEHFPQKFHQALEFASFGGINDLWIDALCIMQDDKIDWSKGSPIHGFLYAKTPSATSVPPTPMVGKAACMPIEIPRSLHLSASH
ncbi:uncharacterized protein Z519_04799 [Cladophialophora bantiana CBS 173.52]|uniref:Heterokaryon incompatibility domain-containing protein n=1 Tax=Cladophialophora bantiana (strain ATCC 10958 / CBS 173.52 / CDC B-1940 / NIH 8579) TaxID=1442370 RepID=A0A0D2EXU8_CLAB1|nr:uncharacterized protein Z519_04799 [Cladophialophora bantiana CBS 173.52]KIW94821.1 hypothetical protein Z519_04799 [Cladophialophora bantiana CBS 173.52]